MPLPRPPMLGATGLTPIEFRKSLLELHMYLWDLVHVLETEVSRITIRELDLGGGLGLPPTGALGYLILPTTPSAPATPTGFSATGFFQQIGLSWDLDLDPSITGWELSRADDAAFTSNVVILTNARSLSFVDGNLGNSTTKYYKLRAIGRGGNSGYTAIVNATTAAAAATGDTIIASLKASAATVQTSHILNAVIGTAQIASAAITTAKIADLAVTTAKIDTLAVTNAKIGLLAVQTGNITDLAVTTAKIDNLAVVTAKIADLSVTTGKIALLAVTTALINDLAVTTGKIADANITTAKIATANITTALIANLAVDTAQIANAAVTTLKVADANITTAKIAAANITTALIADANVTTAKIATANITTALIADANITTAKITDANITTAKIASLAVTTAKIAALAVTAAEIGTAAIETAKINNLAVTTIKIANSNISNLASAQDTTGAAINFNDTAEKTLASVNVTNGTAASTVLVWGSVQHNTDAVSSTLIWDIRLNKNGTPIATRTFRRDMVHDGGVGYYFPISFQAGSTQSASATDTWTLTLIITTAGTYSGTQHINWDNADLNVLSIMK